MLIIAGGHTDNGKVKGLPDQLEGSLGYMVIKMPLLVTVAGEGQIAFEVIATVIVDGFTNDVVV
jgi:hypothetical protein